MSSTEPDNTNTDGEQDADTTNLSIFGPPTAEELRDQLNAQVSEKDEQLIVIAAELAKIEQDYQTALANNADPSTVRHYEELKQAHTALVERCLREFNELMRQCLCARRGANAYLEKKIQRYNAEVQRMKDEAKERKAKREEAARVREDKKRWRSLPVEERKRIRREQQREISVLRRKYAAFIVAKEALEIEAEALRARRKARYAHMDRWDGIFEWYSEALLRHRVYKMLEDLGMRYC
ncbi:uncharacterized protein J4E92_008222 [Alternaria infectoria]|uniref:uncharacterized protein n=1 Tax=Alternaria infectoria TaxID=45303 RepID=UPI002220A908|nr:uncharacterized protein J4E92_008222 [Alternaria infectoria]KAI4921233.1 hypothetical protein J4E92_008222 [Alternaria infectoria]